MSRRLPSLNALRAFEAAARHQSFSRAAEELNVGHSAISRHVRSLEHRLGAQLFRDQSRGVVLSEAGRAYLNQILPAFDAIEAATEDLISDPDGRILISSEPLFAEQVLLPRLPAFHAAFPNVEVRIEASYELADLDRYEADLAIRFASADVLDVPSDLLSNAPLRPFAAPSLLPEGPLSPEQIVTYPLLRDRHNNTWALWCANAGLAPDAAPFDPWRLRPSLAMQAALNGQGVLLASSECMASECASGRLRQCSDIGVRQGSFRLAYGSRGVRRKTVRSFRNWLLDETRAFRSE